MNFRNISSWCIRNPSPPIVLFVGLLLAGLVAFMRMDVNNFPDIEFPAAIVTVSQPGAAPSEMETQVTQRIEAAARGPGGIREPRITRVEGGDGNEISFIAAQTTDMTLEQLSWYVDNSVSRRLLAVPGPAAGTRESGVGRPIRSAADPP